MPDQKIDSLSVEISSNAEAAVDGVARLAESLQKLKKATAGGLGSEKVAKLAPAFKSVADVDGKKAAEGLDSLTRALSAVKNLGKVAVPIEKTFGENIGSLANSLSSLDETKIENLGKVAESLAKFTGVGTPGKGFDTLLRHLKDDLPDVAKSISEIKNVDLFKRNMDTISSAFRNMKEATEGVNSNVKDIGNSIKTSVEDVQKLEGSTQSISDKLKDLALKLLSLSLIRQVGSGIGNLISKAGDYVEAMNLVNASLGEYSKDAQQYAAEVQNALGIDPAKFLRTEGVFNTILEGYGVASDRAYTMSQNLTQLAYDLSSFFNIGLDESIKKLQSGITGEIKAVRQLGYDLSEAGLKQVALNMGITQSYEAMSQAEKAQLRYVALLQQVTVAQGDMARTLNSPMNQLRILKEQLVMAARAIGSIFIPMLNKIVPVVMAVVKAITVLAQAIASLFGYKLQLADLSGTTQGINNSMGGIADGANDAAGGLGSAAKKAKELKNYLLGIDELNVLAPPDDDNSSGSGGGGAGGIGGGGGFDFDLPTYDFLGDAIDSKVEEIYQKLKKLWPVVAGIAAALAAWKLFEFLGGVKALNGLLSPFASYLSVLAGVILTVGGAILYIWGAVDAFRNGLKWDNLLAMIVGIASVSLGLYAILYPFNVALGTLFATVSVLVGSLGLFAISLRDIKKNGANAKNIIGGIAGAIGAIAAVWKLSDGSALPVGLVSAAAGMTLLYSASRDMAANGTNAANAIELTAGVLITFGGAVKLINELVTISPVLGWLGAIGIAAGALYAISAGAQAAARDAYQASDDYKVMTHIIEESEDIINRSSEALNRLADSEKELANINDSVDMAKRLVDEIFAINDNADASAWELELMAVKVDELNALGLDGIRLEIDETTNRVNGTKEAILETIQAFEYQAQSAALMNVLTQTYEDIYRAERDVNVAAQNVNASYEALVATNEQLNSVTNPQKKRELIEAQKEETEAYYASRDALENAMTTLNSLNGAQAEYEKQILQNKYNNGDFAGSFEDLTLAMDKVDQDLSEKASKLPSTVNDAIGTNISDIKYESFGEQISNGWDSLLAFASRNIETKSAPYIPQGIQKGVEDNLRVVEDAAKNTCDSFETVFDGQMQINSPSKLMEEKGMFITEGLALGITEGTEAPVEAMTMMGTQVIEAFDMSAEGGVSARFTQFATEAVTAFNTGITTTYQTSKAVVDTWGKAVQKWFTDIVSKKQFTDNATDIVDAFKIRILGYHPTAVNEVTTWAQATVDAFTAINSKDAWFEIGSFLVEGFIEGVLAKKAEAIETVRQFAQEVNQAFSSTIQIGSPSRLFRQYGAWTVEGYNNGIEENVETSVGIMNAWANRMAGVQFSTPHMTMQMDTSGVEFYDNNEWSRSITPSVTAKADYEVTDNMYNAMREFYESEMKNDIKQMAEDMRRQADKDETVNVQIGNKSVSDAVIEQKRANGFSFVG